MSSGREIATDNDELDVLRRQLVWITLPFGGVAVGLSVEAEQSIDHG